MIWLSSLAKSLSTEPYRLQNAQRKEPPTDSITTTIVAALVAGVIGGVTQVGEHVITDVYEALKAALKNKCGGG